MDTDRQFISREVVVPSRELLWFFAAYLVLLLSAAYIAQAGLLSLGVLPWVSTGIAMVVFGLFFFSGWRLWQRARGANPLGWRRVVVSSIVLGAFAAAGALFAMNVV